MEVDDEPSELRHRLGPEGTAALVELLEQTRQDSTVEVTTAAVERFERRLSDAHVLLRDEMLARDAKLREEIRASHAKLNEEMLAGNAKLREEMLAGNAKLREEMLTGNGKLREEMLASTAKLREETLAGIGTLRDEMHAGDTQLRLEMIHGFASVREDTGVLKFDLLKWNFAFWVGQIVAVATVVGVMLRVMQT